MGLAAGSKNDKTILRGGQATRDTTWLLGKQGMGESTGPPIISTAAAPAAAPAAAGPEGRRANPTSGVRTYGYVTLESRLDKTPKGKRKAASQSLGTDAASHPLSSR